MYTFVDDTIKRTNSDEYMHLVNNSIFPDDWAVHVRRNIILSMFYGKRAYHLKGTLNPDGSVHKYAGEEVMRYY